MENIQNKPDFIFEVSWEVCNKVGGIHTVLATKARTLAGSWSDHFILIGPDLPSHEGINPEFIEDATLFPAWKQHVTSQGLRVKSGRWNVPGTPLVMLIDFTSLYARKNDIFTDLWIKFRLDSLSGQWDYIEPALFGYAAGIAISSFYECHINATDKIIAQFHEWLSGAGILYLEEKVPQVATVFTTHATVLGRAMAARGLAQYMPGAGEAVKKAAELGITSKHSLEQLSASTADCFTAVSAVTGDECERLLGVIPDFITANGFDPALTPTDDQLPIKRKAARQRLLSVASAVLGQRLPEDSLLVLKSGRYEFVNKGIDIFIKSLQQLGARGNLTKKTVAFIFVPAAHTGPVKELEAALKNGSMLLNNRIPVTHNLINMAADPIINLLEATHVNESAQVSALFAPVYLDGRDGIFNMDYYDLLPGFDLGVFPSYYEPWGYTPLESIAFGVPAITSSLSGFGKAIMKHAAEMGSGILIAERNASNDNETIAFIADTVQSYAAQTPEAMEAASTLARQLSRHFTWELLIGAYYMAYDLSIQKSLQREAMYYSKPQATAQPATQHMTEQPIWRELDIKPDIPAALQPLTELAGNLWWSWHRLARDLFTYADEICGTWMAATPHLLLPSLDNERMQLLAQHPKFMAMLHGVTELYRQDLTSPVSGPLTAYFSPEYALYQPLKIYAGGLGVLAGDYLKTVADLRGNMIGIGLLYRAGYFKQQLSATGDQVTLPEKLLPEQLPLTLVTGKDGRPLTISLPFPGRMLQVCAWLVKTGNVRLYLLDTQLPQNAAEDAKITTGLYPADIHTRLQQEIILGMGGIRLLEALSITPDIYHINEGHAAFAGLERIGQIMRREHLDFEQAVEVVKSSTLFTTHTAVPAGIHTYGEEQLRPYFSYLTRELGINWEQLMHLGSAASGTTTDFSLFFLAIRLAQQVNAVSDIHRRVTTHLIQPLWPQYHAAELPVTNITNGVHFPTWLAADWPESLVSHAETANDIEPHNIWKIRLLLKKKMIALLQQRLSGMHLYTNADASTRRAIDMLDEHALFIGFARRVASYKRADLIFSDTDRLTTILSDRDRPVYLIMAGKAHPNDHQGIELLKRIVQMSQQPGLRGRIFFLEDYDLQIAQLLVQGVDLWLNTPRVSEEACGTSGMKAILNGALHCSTLDGWWAEAYRDDAGWAIAPHLPASAGNWRDQQEAEQLYRLLEKQVLPAFFDRNSAGVPELWLRMVRKSMTGILPQFNMKRAAIDYAKQYDALFKRIQALSGSQFSELRAFVQWKQSVREAWHELHVFSLRLPETRNSPAKTGDTFIASVQLYLGTLQAEDICIEVLFSQPGHEGDYLQITPLVLQPGKGNRRTYAIETPLRYAGICQYTFRVYPQHRYLLNKQDLPLVMWI